MKTSRPQLENYTSSEHIFYTGREIQMTKVFNKCKNKEYEANLKIFPPALSLKRYSKSEQQVYLFKNKHHS